MASQSIPRPIDDAWTIRWLPILAIVWTGAFLRVAVALANGETFNFGSTLAAVVVGLVPLVARRALSTVWRLREQPPAAIVGGPQSSKRSR